jgi:murein DD-endopeptidase MepM/ murein hydrolase activator NlpD
MRGRGTTGRRLASPAARLERARRGRVARIVLAVFSVLLAGGLVPRAAGAQTPTTTTPPTSGPTTTKPAPTTTTTKVPGSTTTTTAPPGSSTTTSSTSTTLAPGVLIPPVTLPPGQLDELKKLQDDYEGATDDEIELLKRFLDAQLQATDLAGQVDQLNATLLKIRADLKVAEGAVLVAAKKAADADDRLAEAEQQLADEQSRLRARAVDAYIGGGSGGGQASTNAIMRAETMDDLGKTLVYSDVIVADQRATVSRVVELRDEVDARQVEAADARDEVVRARDQVAQRKAQVEAQLVTQTRTRDSIEATADSVKVLLEEVAKKREAYAARISVLTRVSDGISETLRKAEEGQTLPLNTAGILLSPLPNPVFTSPFGARADPLLGTIRMHNGVDMNGAMGTPIRAPADGVVLIASDVSGYGNCTVIDHGSGIGTLYGHQSTFNVKVGDIVKRGDIIGFVGSTGHSTGPHLHWEVRKFGQPTDPIPFIGPG